MKPKVLLVDDRNDNLVAMQAVLAPLDCGVATAQSNGASTACIATRLSLRSSTSRTFGFMRCAAIPA